MKLETPGRMRKPLMTLMLAMTTMGAGMPAASQVAVPRIPELTGGGLYDFLIQTNCFALSAQADTRTPHWVFDNTYPDNRVPLLASGSAKGIVRTIDLADQVTFTSSKPAVIQTPGTIQAVGAIGGVPYQQTDAYFTIKAPAAVTDVDITAQGSVNSLVGTAVNLGQPKRVTRKFRVYPPQRIKAATLSPSRPAPYREGERLRIDVTVPWKIPISTATVVIGQPMYKNANGQDVRAGLPEWQVGSTFGEKRIPLAPNSDRVSFEFVARFPANAAVEKVAPTIIKTSLVVPVQLTTDTYVPCPDLVTQPRTAEVRYSMQKALTTNVQAAPATSLPAGISGIRPTQVPLPDDSAEVKEPLPTKPDAEPENYPKPRRRQ